MSLDRVHHALLRRIVEDERAVVLQKVWHEHLALAHTTRRLVEPVDRAAVGGLLDQGEC